MAGRIAVIGSNNVDLVTHVTRMPRPGETIEAPAFRMGFGGKGANQAAAAARLGAQVMMVSRTGDDMFGASVRRNLAERGIDVTHVTPAPGLPNGVAPIFVEPSGENMIVIVKGANGALSPADIDAAAGDLAGCDLLLLQLEVPLATVEHAVAVAARLGVPVVLNPAPAPAGLDLSRLTPLAFLCPNETELALLTGLPTGSESEIGAAARSLIAQGGIGAVIVTLGGRGARLVTAQGVTQVAPVPVTPVDTTGAGDAFIGAFAHFHAAGMAVPQALDRAARYAALSITRPGAQDSYADPAAFAAFCEAHP